MRHLRISLLGLLLAAALAGCAGMSRQDENTAVGAGVGALGGAALTGGSAAGTLGGAAAGGLVGHEWGEDIRRKFD